MSNGEGWSAYLADLMQRGGFANAADLSRAAGIDQTQISRWLRGQGQPSLENLRRLAPIVRRPILELAVKAGHFTAEEARLRDVTPEQPSPVADIAEAIKQDTELLDEARQHLLNQYELLRRLSDPAGTTKGPATRPLRAVARPRPSRRDRT